MSKVLTIQRSKWRRGGETNAPLGLTSLLNPDNGMMCCLGFDAIACGLTADQIACRIDPVDVADWHNLPADYVGTRLDGGGVSAPVESAMAHNDAIDISDDTREALIREDLKALGWDDVLFVD